MMEETKALEELASRVEAASGADRELDVRISLALSGVSHTEADVAELLRVRDEPTGYGRYRPADEYVPSYTASLDAAIALAGPGYHLAFDVHFMDDEGVIRYRGYSFRPDWAKWTPHDMAWLNRDGSECPLCATPALALTAACLRARAQSPASDAPMGERP